MVVILNRQSTIRLEKIMKRFAMIPLVFVLLSLAGQASGEPIITLDPHVNTIQVGENLFVDINISGLGNTPLGAFKMDILFSDVLDFLSSGSDVNIFGSALGDVTSGEAVVGSDAWVPGSGKFSFYEVSLLDPFTLDTLQGNAFRLATLAFYVPDTDSLASGGTLSFSLANLQGSDASGEDLVLQGDSYTYFVKVSEPSVFFLLGLGLFGLYFNKMTTNWRKQ